MPLYMDRHDVREATLEQVASAHQNDLEIQARHFCKVLTYWHDVSRGVAFCLVDAPSSSAVIKMHKEAHGLIPIRLLRLRTQL